MSVLSLETLDLSKRFGKITALDGINLKVNEGEVFGYIGPNGAGKTTTIRMILGMLPTDGGEASWNGAPVAKSGLRFGYMPEERGIYMKTKVLEQLVYYGMLRGMPKADAMECARRWLDRLHVSEYADMVAEKLSKGNQQKIQLISTLLHDPLLLFLDEPFSGLDPLNTQMFHDLIQEMARAGKYIVLSSHQMATVEEYCREITLLHKGKALLQGNLREIKAGYGHTKLLLCAPEEAYAMAEAAGLRAAKTSPAETEFALPERDADAICVKLLMDMLARNLVPLKFELTEPTLHEIFIEKVGLEEAMEGGAAA